MTSNLDLLAKFRTPLIYLRLTITLIVMLVIHGVGKLGVLPIIFPPVAPHSLTQPEAAQHATMYGLAYVVILVITLAVGRKLNGWLKTLFTPMDRGASMVGDIAESAARPSEIDSKVGQRTDSHSSPPSWLSPLGIAAANGNLAQIRSAVSAGSSPNQEDSAGGTALMYAIRNNQVGAAQLLLALGADPHRANKKGTTALAFAEGLGNDTLTRAMQAVPATPLGTQV